MRDFTTSRLRLTRLAPTDLAEMVNLHLDPEVSRFLGGVRTAEQTAAYMHTNLQHWIDHGFGLWTLRTSDGSYVGRAGLRYFGIEGRRELEIAYTFVRKAWGRGLATEVAEALVSLWKTDFTDATLVGVVMKGNASSEHVLGKTGFTYERNILLHDEVASLFRQDRPA